MVHRSLEMLGGPEIPVIPAAWCADVCIADLSDEHGVDASSWLPRVQGCRMARSAARSPVYVLVEIPSSAA